MSLITLVSAQGSPGVSTSALGLGLAWSRPAVLVEADPTGASAIRAGYFRGSNLPNDATLIDLALSNRQGTLSNDLPSLLTSVDGSALKILPGVSSHQQSRSLQGIWDSLLIALRGLSPQGQDVLVDAGRLGLESSPEALIYGADLTLLVVRSSLPALAGARSWARTLHETFARRAAESRLGILLIGQGQPYRAREVSKSLGVPVIETLAWDPVSAEVFSRGNQPNRKFESSPLAKSLNAAVEAIQSTITANHEALENTPSTRAKEA